MGDTKKSKYSGILLKRIPDTPPSLCMTDDELKASYTEEVWQRLVALFEHYSIAPDSEGADRKLILALAKDHVRGFQLESEKKKVGSPSKWKGDDGVRLYLEIHKYIQKGKDRTILGACTFLAKNDPFFKNHQAAVLNSRYHETLKVNEFVKGLELLKKENVDYINVLSKAVRW